MKKKLLTLALAAVCAVGGFLGFSHVSQAATTSYVTLGNSQIVTSEKVGKYYFQEKNGNFTVRKSKRGDSFLTIKHANTNICTNGTYVYYVNENNNYLYRTTLSSKKTVRLAKIKGDYSVNHVYGSAVYLNNCNPNDSCNIKVYNTKKKTQKTIVKNAWDNPISGYGSKLVYKMYKTDKVYLRNCSTGKTTELTALKGSNNFKIYGNKIAYVEYNEKTDQFNVNIYNTSTKKVTKVQTIGTSKDADFMNKDNGEFTTGLTQYIYGNYILNIKTGAITKR